MELKNGIESTEKQICVASILTREPGLSQLDKSVSHELQPVAQFFKSARQIGYNGINFISKYFENG